MTTLGLIGSGNIGGTLARLAVAAGIDVVLSNSRGPESLAELVGELGERARAGTAEEAAAAGDIVVVTVPLKAYRDVPAEPLVGKVVIDTNNYYPERDGEFPDLEAGTATSSELLQRHLPRSRVVKAFNNIYFKHLAVLSRPAGAPDRSALPIAGDDSEAKAAAAQLISALGFDTVDIGGASDSWRTQPGTPVYGPPYAVSEPFWESEAKPGDAETVRKAVEAAERG
ncbi:NADPH-dependent F420 reductase [Nocardia sp. NBC_01503]|uniref:NADPH-dependent F420 reductase n=1 Tax=Nocardia sp. NBC_01503 TaxID=2975997 RepID=UPI002E7C4B0D|nr:NADPH-dependent F420 reductase [Nocardia sp. NBC_01503]WTL29702.1 NADPH-dependent F420 reductase [Nocardia sp. NBC_01503]